MQITHMTEGVMPDTSLAGTLLSVQGYALDLAARQQEHSVTLDLSLTVDGDVVEGADGGWYLANIRLPALAYDDTEVDGEVVRTPLPLDTDQVTVTLWALPTNLVTQEP